VGEPESEIARVADAGICPTCGDASGCGMTKGETTCWCFALPHVMPLNENVERCFCRDCLMRLIAERTSDDAGQAGDTRH
jgi:hypothetical protein